ncbi:hypothetical protein COOONC_24298 [Cooperia oncophora]
MALARFQFFGRVHRNDSNAELFDEELHRTNNMLRKDLNARSTILAYIGNFERNINVISTNLQRFEASNGKRSFRKAAQKRLRMRWVLVCERLDSLLLMFFLTINSLFFAVLLLIGYLSN